MQTFLPLRLLSRFLYPALCLHCREEISQKEEVFFCPACQELLHLIDSHLRCRHCFSLVTSEVFSKDKEGKAFMLCSRCRKNPKISFPLLFAFEAGGAALSLFQKLKTGRFPALAKGAAAFMVAQAMRNLETIPDFVIPLLDKKRGWGYDLSFSLAEEVASLLGRPLKRVLKKRRGLFQKHYDLREPFDELFDHSLLLVFDSRKEELSEAFGALRKALPSKIIGLGLMVD